ncbi:MAG: RES family NAD+ phosphorylase [Edaphocola sp.]
MVVFRIAKCQYISDLSGTGAAVYGGRWNSEGVHILYTAGSGALAMLESLVHFGGRIVGDYCQMAIEIPETGILSVSEAELPANWREHPAPNELRIMGNKFIEGGKYLAMSVPSVLVPNELNYLLNPAHNDFKKVQVLLKNKIRFDERLIKRG